MEIRVHLTGQMSVVVDGRAVVQERHFRGRQTRLVFAFLVAERAQPVPRDRVAAVVWGSDLPGAWDVALSALLSRTRSLLASSGLAREGVGLPQDPRLCQMQLPTGAWVDLETCAAALDTAEGALRTGNLERVLGPAFVAATIARRPFLADVESEWVTGQRARLDRLLTRAEDCLVRMWTLTGEAALSVETATAMLSRDPYRETTYRLLMRAHAAAGHRARALDVYAQMRALFQKELGLDPSPETEAVYLDLLK